ncbi:MAG TPA: RHS repeat-associated core domain-containing protein, partial [Flavobacterium sp.]|nr:RHS repeat-associated core domain-containing protein [Flavobacterium sp.]
NDIMTRYVYDNRTFRLLRQRSEKYAKTHVGNTITYTPQSGTNRQDDEFNFDLVGNILKILHRVNDCGISGSPLGSNALDRNFDYDPLYRVISADGRESDTQHENDYLYSDAPAPGTPNANNVRAYTRNYAFDKLGNIQQVKQLGTNGFTRNFTYNAGHNTLQKVETPTPTLIENFTYDVCGNQLTAGTTRNYVWNAGNQLITYYNQVGSADPTIFAQYDYSGMNRVSKFVKTGTTYERTIYIDGIFEYCILENGTTYEKNYVHVMDDQSRIAMVRAGTPFPDDIADAVTYNLEDQIGSSVARLDNNGTVIDREEFYPFGDSSLRTFSKKRYRYVGKEKDAESGLYYYGARYYLPWTCRFISIDPLASDYPFYTPYNYAGNKPINKIDIDGMQEQGGETAPTETGKNNIIENNNIENTDISISGNENKNSLKSLTLGGPFIIPNYSFGLYTTIVDNTSFKTEDYSSYKYLWPGYAGIRFDEPSNMVSLVDYISPTKEEGNYMGYSLRLYHYKRNIDENFHFSGGLNELSFNVTSYHKIKQSNFSFFAGGGLEAMMINPGVHGHISDAGGYSEKVYGSGCFYQFGGVGGSAHTGFAYKASIFSLKNGSNFSFQAHAMGQINANATVNLKSYDGQGNIIFNQRYMSIGAGGVFGISFSYNF